MSRITRITLLTTFFLLAAAGSRVVAQEIDSIPGEGMTVNQFRAQRGLTEMGAVIVPKGQWVFGANAAYSTHTNESYNFLIIEGIESNGYTFKVSPLLAYAIRDNMAVGVRGTYSRTNLTIDKADLKFGSGEDATEIKVTDYKSVQHSYSVAASWRQYIPLGASKRFAIFTEVQLGAGGTQSTFVAGQPVKGTYETGYTVSLGVSPGLVAFATNNVAIELNVGVMGLSYSKIEQVHNQVTVGERSSSNMNFKINIFSIGVGVAFYL